MRARARACGGGAWRARAGRRTARAAGASQPSRGPGSFQCLAQLAHLLGWHLLRLAAEDAVDGLDGGLEVFLASSAFLVSAASYRIGSAAQVERQQPLAAVVVHRHAAHLQRAHLGHARVELHFDLRLLAPFRRGQHGGERRQLHPALACERRDLPGLRGCVMAVGDEREAHRLPQPQGEAPPGEHDAHAFSVPRGSRHSPLLPGSTSQ